MVWASQCLAFIRYYRWLRQWVGQLPEYYNRWATPRLEWQTKRPFLSSGQPIVAWVGLVGCLLIVFVLSTARWWNGSYTVGKVATAFAGVSLETTSSVGRELANLSTAHRPARDIRCSKAKPEDSGHRGSSAYPVADWSCSGGSCEARNAAGPRHAVRRYQVILQVPTTKVYIFA